MSSLATAGAGLKAFAQSRLAYLLIRQSKLQLEDLSVCMELDQAVDSAPGLSRLTSADHLLTH